MLAHTVLTEVPSQTIIVGGNDCSINQKKLNPELRGASQKVGGGWSKFMQNYHTHLHGLHCMSCKVQCGIRRFLTGVVQCLKSSFATLYLDNKVERKSDFVLTKNFQSGKIWRLESRTH